MSKYRPWKYLQQNGADDMANVITCCRILSSILIMFVPVLSPCFYVLYVFSGITDILDGYIARKTSTTSMFGANLDSIADFIFVIVCLVKVLPSVDVPQWLWIWIAVIAMIKLINILSGYVYQQRFVMLHTRANKATGLILFLCPISFLLFAVKYIAIPVCAIATFAAIQEGHYIRTWKNCD